MSEEIILLAQQQVSLEMLAEAAGLDGPTQCWGVPAFSTERGSYPRLYILEDSDDLEEWEESELSKIKIDSPRVFVLTYMGRGGNALVLDVLKRILGRHGSKLFVDNNRDLILRGDLLLKRFRTEGTDFFFRWSE